MRIKDVATRALLRLPSGPGIDRAIHALYFYVAHNRLPREGSGLFNDYLYFLKCSHEIDLAIRQFVSDKEYVKLFYRGVFGRDLAPKTLRTYDALAQFSEADLPSPCVLKPSHLSGCLYFDRRQGSLTAEDHQRIAGWFEQNIYRDISRERNYRNLQPRVFCEERIASEGDVRDYKIFCYRGEPRAIQVDVDRHSTHKRRLYTAEWSALPYTYNKPLADVEERPARLAEALDYARTLARRFEFIRVDTYLSSDKVYLGELTNVPENAHGRFENEDAERGFMRLLETGVA